jgi:pimeloyl-ACP methyl ester carboxylesterase
MHALADTGHWIQQERPDEVNDLLLTFLGARFT